MDERGPPWGQAAASPKRRKAVRAVARRSIWGHVVVHQAGRGRSARGAEPHAAGGSRPPRFFRNWALSQTLEQTPKRA